MKKNFLLLLLTLSSCMTDKINDEDIDNVVKSISVKIEDVEFEEPDSRVSVIPAGTVKYLWELGDVLGVFPDVGGQVDFAIDEDFVGKDFATFDGGGWALKGGHTYSAYYPFDFYNRDSKKIPFSYLGQEQNGDNSLSHLRDYVFMGCGPAKVENAGLTFLFAHKGVIANLILTLPTAVSLKSLDVIASKKAIPVKKTFNIQTAAIDQNVQELSNKLSLDLKNIATTEDNKVVNLWMVFPTVDEGDVTMTALIKDVEGNEYEGQIVKSNKENAVLQFNQGKARRLYATLKAKDGMQSSIENWEEDEEIFGEAD